MAMINYQLHSQRIFSTIKRTRRKRNVIAFIVTVSDQFRMNLAPGKIKVKSN